MERLERQQALEKERARIAKDIHDDLGASLTRIILLSPSGRAELEDPHQAAADLDQIYLTARTLTRALDEIVWALSPQHDTLDSLVTYLGKFAQEFLSAAGIRCRLDVPMQLPRAHLTAEVRHNLFCLSKKRFTMSSSTHPHPKCAFHSRSTNRALPCCLRTTAKASIPPALPRLRRRWVTGTRYAL